MINNSPFQKKLYNKEGKIKRFKKIDEINLYEFNDLKIIIDEQLKVWPQHESFIATSLGNQASNVLSTINTSAKTIKIIATEHFNSLRKVCEGYRYFCEKMILDSELHFRRYGKYERSTLEEAFRDIYSQPDIMQHYMNGLLISGVFWSNHAKALHFYHSEFLPLLPENFFHLEVGPGHGALLDLTVQQGKFGKIEAWDISPSSIQATARTLKTIGVERSVNLVCQDLMEANIHKNKFDSIVVSELLEHLENPLKALKSLKQSLKDGGLILINMPINSPAPDHLYLLRCTSEVIELVKKAELKILRAIHFPMTGYTISECKAHDLTITSIVIAQK